MPHRRARQRGSFGSHFDELVMQFSDKEKRDAPNRHQRSPELQERLDIHRRLFDRAWGFDDERRGTD